jgi:hypothetical protein
VPSALSTILADFSDVSQYCDTWRPGRYLADGGRLYRTRPGFVPNGTYKTADRLGPIPSTRRSVHERESGPTELLAAADLRSVAEGDRAR